MLKKITENLTECYSVAATIEGATGTTRVPASEVWTPAELDARKAEIRRSAPAGSTVTFKTKTHQL